MPVPQETFEEHERRLEELFAQREEERNRTLEQIHKHLEENSRQRERDAEYDFLKIFRIP